MPCERKHIEAIEKILDREINYVDPASELSLRAVINAALAACDESPWRSMESAPKDEVVYLAYIDEEGEQCCSIGRKRYGNWVVGFGCDDCNTFYDSIVNPTHWMPLPAAPEVGK